jgi:hypothetical protein
LGREGSGTNRKKVDDHVPLPAVADEVAAKMVDETVVEWEVRVRERELQVVVCLVELVVEEEVGLWGGWV